MLAIDKVIELTEGKYHYRAKEIEHLLGVKMLEHDTLEYDGKVHHFIKTSVRSGKGQNRWLLLSKTRAGKNRGSWRITGTYDWYYKHKKERQK